jgi:hypothetical protein
MVNTMLFNLKSVALGTAIGALVVMGAIGPVASAEVVRPMVHADTALIANESNGRKLVVAERLGRVYPGRGSIQFRGQTIRVVSYVEVFRRDDRKVLILNLANGKNFKTLRLSGKVEKKSMTLRIDRGGFNLPSDEAGQADISGRLSLKFDRGVLRSFQGRVVFDSQPIGVRFAAN